MRLTRPRTLLPVLAVAGASLVGGASTAQAASSTLNYGADLVLIPKLLPTQPETKCPKTIEVQVNGRRIGYAPTSTNVYGTCPVRGTVTVPYAPGTTVLFSATGAGVWPVFGLRRTTATPAPANS